VNTAVYGAIIRHRLRTTKNMLKHYWPSFLGMSLGFAYLGYRFLVAVLGGGIGITLGPKSVCYVLLACVILNGYRVFITRTPAIAVNAATVHYLRGTSHFNKILIAEYAWVLVKSLLTALLLSGLMDGFRYSGLTLLNALLLGGYMFSGSTLSWINYHRIGNASFVTGAGYILSSMGILAKTQAVRHVLVWSALLWATHSIFVGIHDLNLLRYSRDMALIDETTAAASRFDIAQMIRITAEHNANRKRSLLLHNLPLKRENAIFLKGAIETIRAGGQIWIVLFGLQLLGVLVFRTPVFAEIPFIGDPATAAPISVILIMTAYANIGEMLKRQLGTLLEKRRKGLFLPVGDHHIAMSYVFWGCLLYAAATVLTGWLMASKWLFVLVFYVLSCGLFAFDLFVKAKRMKLGRLTGNILRIMFVVLGFLFVAR
jgi:hypothetical protein